MPHGDDLDARFNELVSQIDADEQRKMRASAAKGAKAPQRARRPRRARRGLLAAAAVTAVIAAAGLVLTYRPDLLTPSPVSPVRQAASIPPPEETQPVVEAPQKVGPFTDSKAEHFADGMAGFQLPKAKALAGLSKAEVRAGLDRVGKLFQAAYLDRETLMGAKPESYLKLLDPDERSWYRKKPRMWVNSFAPKTAELATNVIKVHGTTTLSTKKDQGRTVIVVKTNYLVVYAIRRPGQPDTTMRLVTHPKGVAEIYREEGHVVVWVTDGGASATPARCDVHDYFIHPMYEDSEPDAVQPSGPPRDPYELDKPESEGCATSTGT
ncbi:hypothetical protein ACIBHX_12220 [Nonomuraea sp. NPDC050536]|uniref:hypothetical protein n=1 Tax=Nonomuraea sp. NPDC050536 TaxID=3364366 RepID=UPI0037C7B5DD